MACLPVDRPHDPGDAADLSIMGYGCPLSGTYVVVGVKIAQNEKKINRFLIPNPL